MPNNKQHYGGGRNYPLSKKLKKVTEFYGYKVDLEKAYNRLNWEFIHDTLLVAGI